MQICALDLAGSFIYADQAAKHQDYLCLECGQTLRLRQGLHRQAHYYHLQANRLCKQHAKGMPHLMLQIFLKKSLPEGEADLEFRFPQIGRIADVAWHAKKIIFEVQCSPINAEEVKKRNESYASIGYQVIWIFHEDRYNQSRLSSAEHYISKSPHYFTNMNANGEGVIYDQFSITEKGKRIRRFAPLIIDPSLPKIINKNAIKLEKKLESAFYSRINTWPLIFSGDTLDCFFNSELKDQCFFERKTPLYDRVLHIIKDRIMRPYLAILKLILERACK